MPAGLRLHHWMIPALAGIIACPAAAQAPISLGLPVDCNLGGSCFIQQYVDHDSGPGARDFACHALSYDGHKGTDFAVISERLMQAGVPVIAAAPGVVAGTRDGMRDVSYTPEMKDEIDGRDCGNGVRIEHRDGWSTQYCHLQKGSVAVREGDTVERGDRLGRIGLSGRTQFPHLHVTLRHNGEVVDPFVPGGAETCTDAPTDTLWLTPPSYRPGGILAVGFSDVVPSFAEVKAGTANDARLHAGSDKLIVWGYVFGGREGDATRITLTGPEGEVVQVEEPVGKNRAQFFRAAGKRLRGAAWPAGLYTGRFELLRGGAVLERSETHLMIR